MIKGVEIKKLTLNEDNRGFFIEMVKTNSTFLSEGVAQVSHSLVKKGVIKAWHAHRNQTQWNYVVNGLINVMLYDNRIDSSTYKEKINFYCGDKQQKIIYKFPPGVLHGYKCIEGPMNIIYLTSGQYDINDEVRISPEKIPISLNFNNS